ncbi:MAG TPA: LuxR family transcriptional regulator [Pseudonocardiaceae bacterium]|jgi:DNA-binding NarL/FixJ family response regulator|nr:LuxR family transcriptional regulator [Pseudonocardiaceae bacterium]
MVDFDEAAGGRVRAVVQYRRRLLLEALAQWLVATRGFAVVGVTDKVVELPRLCERCQPDIVVLEVDAAGPELVALLARVRAAAGSKRQQVIGLYENGDPNGLARRCDGQVQRLVSVGAGLSALRAALRDTVAGSPSGNGSVGLTSREHEVLILVCAGCSAVQIGNALGISVHTVVNHKRRIFSKLGVQSRAQAMAEVTRLGLVDRDSMRSAWLLAVRSPRSPVTLTGRERDILASIACGHTVRQTAQGLGIAIKTVQSEQRQLFSRLGATNRAEALVLASGLGLVADIVPAARTAADSPNGARTESAPRQGCADGARSP